MLALLSLCILAATTSRAGESDNELQTRPKIKPYPPGSLNSRLLAGTPEHDSSVKNWTESATLQDAIPLACYDAVKREGLNPADVEVFTVTYDDCSTPWELCRHQDAERNLPTVRSLHSKIPVRARELLPYALHLPGPERAYRTSEILVLGGKPDFLTIMHQVGRAIDDNCGFPGKDRRCSDTETWRNAFDRDTYVVDDIARTSQAENFAQIVIHTVVNLNFPGGLASMGATTDGQFSQNLYDDEVKVQTQYCGPYLVANPDDKCDNFRPKREYVSKSTGEKIEDPFKAT
ncbi:hypothetical protein A1Q2_03545 [Trichosporon asahii var. asahii CBS 8904]|uniref:Uncharacterized protein n=1 Tax=Trichosporon asahii var. asahii (strain CBS 8904) TaxID=1220162 RepID=K1VZJ0_TRIAC|nr:hypothetical protein A1Q2_03545 [Trichosporon asahii var. asahii CBS 8904]